MKKCGKCKQEKDFSEFHKRVASVDGLCYDCKSCRSTYYSAYQRSTEEKRRGHLRRYFNITAEQYDELLKQQDYSCALCCKPESYFQRRLAVDHDHSCCPGHKSCGKCVRGLLCPACNTFLGKVESGAVTLEQLATYQGKFAH